MQMRRGIKPSEDDAGASWSQTSSVRSSRSGDGGTPVPHPNSAKPAELAKNMPHGPMKIDNTGLVHQLPSNERDSPSNTQPVLWQHRPAPRQQERQPDSRERRDSGSCDHTESELNGMVFRDVSTNTPSTQEVHFARLPELDNAVGPGVVSSDRHGNELVTIGTQTTEVVMSAECAYEPSVENVRGCSKAATPQQLSDFYHGAWPIVDGDVSSSNSGAIQETQSVMSFHSSISSHSSRPSHHYKDASNKDGSSKGANQQSGLAGQTIAESHPAPIALQPLITGGQPLGTKVQMVYSLISMLGTHDPEDMSQTLLAMSSSPDSCIAMRQSGCLPLLVQLIYGSESEKEALTAGKLCRARACQALHNIIHSPPDDKRSRRELKLLKYIEIVQSHCESIRGDKTEDKSLTEAAEKIWPPSDIDRNPGPAVAALMKLSFDDHCRPPIVELGGLPCMAQLIKLDQASYSANSDLQRITMRRYACMTLTNLTFGDCNNKARLCAMQSCLNAIVLQLQAFNEDLCQVAASVIRNLSWKADQASKRHLRVSSATTKLMITAIQVKRESTLKSILSALWNLSAHCTFNKTCICEVDGSIEFLVGMLSYQSPTKTPAIVECAGGILRNISSVIAVRDDYRKILRAHNALKILLSHLKSPSMTVVGNACGALWNISARCVEDQQTLIELGLSISSRISPTPNTDS
ncbi:hypothetical protein EB796_024448 [Bugula neritina]|uniref:Uncharacterized protein n=1 Tax=Bugula neritina TaxID=10212 RepID=A0A7J7ITK4_BUGNE|nr:hypothetical protein EB796_024448 [Bugula neritina]